ncbi:SANT/Myb domain [Dillenia turbinata]|uniref:SANT/Myb domain n=1 Tax=Dillenia turbinata TaxID=194707 RepID=A0AAN8Z0B2_9MAGN
MENQHCNSLSLPFESSEWTFEENKLFENAIAEFDIMSPDFFQKIALRLPGKTVEQIRKHFEALVADVKMISSVHLPTLENVGSQVNFDKSTTIIGGTLTSQLKGSKRTFWTDKEHENFLEGLARHGRGDWKSISRNWVPTRTAAQVASHAQKYFYRLEKEGACSSNSAAKTGTEDVLQPLVPNHLEDRLDPLPIQPPCDPKTMAEDVPQLLEPSLLEDHVSSSPNPISYDTKTMTEDVPQPLEPSR